MTRLIVQTGSTFPRVAAEHGDYDRWFAEGLGWSDAVVCAVDRGAELPALESVSAVVVTGSASMVSQREDWSERCAAWLAAAVRSERPVLGVCYGHQLIAHALGGEVGPNPRGRQVGTVALRTTAAGREDALLGGLGERPEVHCTHVESVLRLPEGATLLAATELDPHHAFRVGARTWCVQFHPEFDARVLPAYVEERREALVAEGLDPDATLAAMHETPVGPELLRRFAALASDRGSPSRVD